MTMSFSGGEDWLKSLMLTDDKTQFHIVIDEVWAHFHLPVLKNK